MNGFDRRKQKKMEQIWAASFDLFSSRGFVNVSVNEIAGQAGVSPATIYNYFGTKERLHADTLAHWLDKQLEQYGQILNGEQAFPEKVKEIMRMEALNLTLLLGGFGAPDEQGPGALELMLREPFDSKLAHFFQKLIALGKREGYFSKNMPDEMVAQYFAMYKRELARQYEEGRRQLPEGRLEQWMTLFFYGLAGEH